MSFIWVLLSWKPPFHCYTSSNSFVYCIQHCCPLSCYRFDLQSFLSNASSPVPIYLNSSMWCSVILLQSYSSTDFPKFFQNFIFQNIKLSWITVFVTVDNPIFFEMWKIRLYTSKYACRNLFLRLNNISFSL